MTTKKTPRKRGDIEHLTDPCGTEVARVWLSARGPIVTLDASDLQKLIDDGWLPVDWFMPKAKRAGPRRFGVGYPHAWNARRPPEKLSRLIAGASRGEIVRYQDRNDLNLRRRNLVLVVKPTTEAAA